MRSVMVGTSTSARAMAPASSSGVMGWSSALSSTSKSSRIRASTGSGKRRVTTTFNLGEGMRIPVPLAGAFR